MPIPVQTGILLCIELKRIKRCIKQEFDHFIEEKLRYTETWIDAKLMLMEPLQGTV